MLFLFIPLDILGTILHKLFAFIFALANILYTYILFLYLENGEEIKNTDQNRTNVSPD